MLWLDLADAVKTTPSGHTGHTECAERDDGGLTLKLAADVSTASPREIINSHCLASDSALVLNRVL